MKLSNLEIKFNEERTFGVEMECILEAEDHREVMNGLEREGISARVGRSHNDSPEGNEWLVTIDGSLDKHGIDSYSHITAEVVSPILKGREGLRKLEVVTDILNDKFDAKINKSCGLHIHHGIEDLSFKRIQKLFKLYANYEKGIDELLPKSRRENNNRYAKSLRTLRGTTDFADYFHKIHDCNTIQELQSAVATDNLREYNDYNTYRYHKLNFDPYESKGTVEFRQHSGTTDFEKIKNWILLGQALIQRTQCRVVVTQNNIDNPPKWNYIKHQIGLTEAKNAGEMMQEMAEFYKGRKQKFDNKYNQAQAV